MMRTPSARPEELHLSNGIPVILQHYDGPVAATYWWVRTGSADEAPAEAGFAHFLEHMLFKDAAAKETGKASTGQMARAIESLGGDINAYTSFDQTVYHVTCSAHHWERVIDAFGTMAKPQRFLRDDFEREREVILEELRKNEDSPGRQLFQQLFSLTFRKHPYGRPVIGFTKTLKAAKVGQLEAFYKRNYVAGKMGLVLVGPIHDSTGERKAKILKYLEKHFGAKVLPKKSAPAPAVKRAQDNPISKGMIPPVVVKPFSVKTPTASFSFRVPDLQHEDVTAIDLLAGILGMGELSRLYQRLFYETSMVTDVSGGVYIPKDPGLLYFQAETEDVSKLQAACEEMFKVLRRIRDEGPTEDELKRVVVNAESEKLYSTQSADGMAGRVGFMKFILGDLEHDHKFLDELRSIDVARIREIARKYLDPRRMSGVLLVPKENKDFDPSEIAEAAARILAPEPSEIEEAEKSGRATKRKSVDRGTRQVEFFRLESGLKIAYYERPTSQVFSVHASALGGLRLELTQPIGDPKTDWGSSHLMASTWTKGTKPASGGGKNARDIAAIFEGSAANIDGFSGRNSVGVQMTGLARDWGKLSEIFGEILFEPAFHEEEIAHSRRVIEDSIRGIEDHSSQLCSKLFLETLFEKHPYGKMTMGSLESVGQIDGAKLREYHRRWVRPERLTLAISGPVKRTMLESWLRDLESRARARSAGLPPYTEPAKLADEPALKAPRWTERTLGREQLHMLVGGLGTKIDAEDRHAIRLLQTLLGGQSGRLFIELREKKSLAYTVAPVSFEGMERGYIGTYIASAPSKKEEAIAGIRSVLEKLASNGPSAAEMNRAKEFLLGRRAMDLQSDSSLAAHFGLEHLYGVPHLDDDAFVKKVRAISSKEIQRVCRVYLVDPFMVTAVVG